MYCSTCDRTFSAQYFKKHVQTVKHNKKLETTHVECVPSTFPTIRCAVQNVKLYSTAPKTLVNIV